MIGIQLLHSRSDPEFMAYFWLVFPIPPNIHVLNSIDNSGILEYRGNAVYPHLVPELQNSLRMFLSTAA